MALQMLNLQKPKKNSETEALKTWKDISGVNSIKVEKLVFSIIITVKKKRKTSKNNLPVQNK